MAELLVVRSKLKDYTDLHISGDFADALSKEVESTIKKAEMRAKENGRKTLKACDI